MTDQVYQLLQWPPVHKQQQKEPENGSQTLEIELELRSNRSNSDEASNAESASSAPSPSLASAFGKSPTDSSSFFGRVVYYWLTPLLQRGALAPLTVEDVMKFPLPADSEIRANCDRLEAAWNDYQLRAKVFGDHPKWLMYALLRTFGRAYAWTAMPMLIDMALHILRPLALSELLQSLYVLDGSDPPDSLAWQASFFPSVLGYAVFLVSFLLVSATIRGFASFYERYANWKLSMEVKTSLSSLVFRKTLRLPTVRRGMAANLLNVDPYKVSEVVWYLLRAFGYSVLILLIVLMLGRWLGIAALTPVVLILLVGPFSAYLWKQFAEAELNIMLIKDKRIKALSEILHAILVVKLMNWEERMKAKVNGIRRKELSFVRQLLMAEAGSQVVSLSLILFTSVLMFLIYLLLGNEMTANVVFPSLIYVYELNWPLLSLADTFRAFSDAWNSSQRIYHFLNKEEIHENKLLMTGSNEADTPREMYNHRTPTESKDDKQMEDEDEEETEEEVIVLKDACFEWYEEGDECEDEDEQDKEQSQQRKNGTEDEDDSEDDEMEEEGKQDRKKRLRIGGQKADPLLSAADATIISPSTAASFPSAGSEPASLTVSTVDSCRSPCISNLNFCVRRGELVMVIGRVGAFKSALLKGILGELKLISGQRLVSGKVGYVPQSAWIRSDTVEQNIKFAYPDEEDEFYKQVLSVCCLSDDLRMFPQGDQTKIGEKGITVSGGQRQRCSLARAVYSRPDILLLDDVLSAVDAHVGKAIFHNCLMGPLLAGTTRVLVTHALQYLPYADRIVVMNAGKIVQMGTFEEMSTQGVDFSEWLKTAEEKQNEKEQQEQVQPLDNNSNQQTSTSAANSPEILLHSCSLSALPIHQSSLTLTASNAESEPVNSAPSCRVESKFAIQLSTSVVESSAHKPVQPRQDETAVDTGTGIVEEEERETGAVSLKVYWTYFKSVGSPWFLVLLVLISIGQECSYQLSSVWLAEWSSAAAAGVLADNSTSTNATNLNSSVRHASVSPSASLDGGWSASSLSTRFYLVVYLGLAVANLLCLFSRQFTWFNGVLNASFRFHDSLLHAILYARMSFFYSTPTGRVTNRFSKDISSVDQHLPNCINAAWMCLLAICAVAILVSSLLPIMIPVLLVVFYAYFKVYQFYKCSVRELGRLESLTASPIFAHYGEVIEGLDSVRAFRAQNFLQGESEAFLQRNANVFFLLGAAHSWLGVRVELLASMVLFAISCLAIISSSFLPPAFLGLLLTSTELCTADLSWFVRMAAVVESTMNSVERLNHFIETPAEESAEQAAQRPPPLWPSRGEIVFDKVSMRYRPGLPLVIKGVDMKIAAREKIGIVGKTGAGKSSLTALLFRLVDIEAESKILIDGVDIRQVSLSSLRQCLAVISQDPILFSGTIRSNLDPFHQHLDSQIWTALASVSLADKVRAYPKQLRTAVADNGKNFSVGERQLFCMARAMLRQDAKVVVLDEASSNVDQISDSLIQNTLRQAFDDRTVLIIAHRLHTIIHCDRVLVMHAGSAVEFDSPANLLRKEGGKFRALVEELGEASAAVLKKEAEEAENKKAVV